MRHKESIVAVTRGPGVMYHWMRGRTEPDALSPAPHELLLITRDIEKHPYHIQAASISSYVGKQTLMEMDPEFCEWIKDERDRRGPYSR